MNCHLGSAFCLREGESSEVGRSVSKPVPWFPPWMNFEVLPRNIEVDGNCRDPMLDRPVPEPPSCRTIRSKEVDLPLPPYDRPSQTPRRCDHILTLEGHSEAGVTYKVCYGVHGCWRSC